VATLSDSDGVATVCAGGIVFEVGLFAYHALLVVSGSDRLVGVVINALKERTESGRHGGWSRLRTLNVYRYGKDQGRRE
jgi:hypothetical protein